MKTSVYDMPDYHALVRRIRDIDRADGDSTLARLVTADWLEDRGEAEHAELIRLDLEPPADAATELVRLKRQVELTRLVGSRQPDGDGLKSRGWADGFVERVECTLAWWLAHGPDLCRRHPVGEVVITDARPNAYLLCTEYADGTSSSRPQWSWLEQFEAEWIPGDRADVAPAQFVPFLGGRRGENPRWRIYDSEADARRDCAAAALRWAEAEADRHAPTEAPAG